MKKRMSKIALTAGCMAMVLASLSGCSQQKVDENAKAFTPSLDTEKSVSLEISGFMGNFEALDQVVNSFNEYYPNVTISYEQNNWAQLAEYMQNKDYIDIFMTDDLNVRYSDWTDQYVGEHCVDKSETFSANPFEYIFVYAPMGDKGAYEYHEPWYGFSVNRDSDEKDYAIEFIRFLMMEDQINQMASVKGMSSVAKNSSNDLYKDIQNPGNIESCFVNDGTVESGVQKNIGYKLNDPGKGNLSSVDETVQAINEICSWKE